jgi:rifampicin phosphotransferase
VNANDFDKMQSGSILVCLITLPAWTQSFVHALGLLTGIGEIVGHGSIVVRDYGIPAMVATGNLTQRVKNGQTLDVRGDAGTAVIQE